MELTWPSPKQPQSEAKRDWYPYYAGFTNLFVEEVVERYLSKGNSRVLDPWSGSGTTIAACVARGHSAIGLDINPVMTVIARARLAPASIAESLIPLGEEILRASVVSKPAVGSDDPLDTWFKPGATARIRGLQAAIDKVLSTEIISGPPLLAGAIERLPVLVCFYYTVLIAAVRDLTRPFRSSNPTWVRTPKDRCARLSPSWRQLQAVFKSRVGYFASRLLLSGNEPGYMGSGAQTASARELPFEAAEFDGCITSPPYATRIDYVVGMLPELATLGAKRDAVRQLRIDTTGSPVVEGLGEVLSTIRSKRGRDLCARIAAHGSKGSKNYYSRWLAKYLSSLEGSCREIRRVVRPGGPICMVVQDSHYKELHIDLQGILIEVFRGLGAQICSRVDFDARRHRAIMNPRARVHRPERRVKESLLVFL